MTAKELSFVKRIQKEYFDQFGSRLVIDFNAMNKIQPRYTVVRYVNIPFDPILAFDFLESSCKKYNTTIDNIKKKLNNSSKYLKERKVLKEYAQFIFSNGWSPREAAEFVGKERTTIIHHNEKKNNLKPQKSK